MNIRTLGAAVLAGAVLAGCGEKATDGEQAGSDSVAVTVNGKTLMKSQIAADVDQVVKAQSDKVPEAQRAYFRQMAENQIVQAFIVENVLVAKAKAEGYVVTDADRKAREAEFLKAIAGAPDAPKSVEEYFKRFPLGEERGRQEFENGMLIDKMIKAQQAKLPAKDYEAEAKKVIDDIVAKNASVAKSETDALAKIKSLKAELDKAKDVPAKFAELAKANSSCPSSAKGGDLGEFTHGQMVKEFDEAAFSLPIGKVSDPVKHKHFTGVSQEPIRRHARMLAAGETPFILRMPMIPGVNDTEEHFRTVADLVKDAASLVRVDILPYQPAAGAKYVMVGKDYRVEFDETVKPAYRLDIFDSAGIPYQVFR